MASQKELFILAAGLIGIAVLLGIILAIFRSPLIWLILFSGLCLAVFYTCSQKGLKYIALGELTVFLAFGPLMIEGVQAVQLNSFSLKSLYLSIPIGMQVALILLANNLRDVTFDAQGGIKTLATLLGRRGALKFFTYLSYLPYILILIYASLGLISWACLLVFAALPKTIGLINKFKKNIPANADGLVSQVFLLFGLLLIISIIIEKVL